MIQNFSSKNIQQNKKTCSNYVSKMLPTRAPKGIDNPKVKRAQGSPHKPPTQPARVKVQLKIHGSHWLDVADGISNVTCSKVEEFHLMIWIDLADCHL